MASSKPDECVRVMVRIRPMSSREKQDGRQVVATANSDRAEICISHPVGSEPPKSFTFDAAFGSDSTQQQVYDTAATEIVEAVVKGYNGTIFAYGQTGAGKSHTMEGYGDQPGIIPASFRHIFDKVAVSANTRMLVRASYLEIYNEEIRDLLGKDPRASLELKENADAGVYVKALTSQVVKDAAEIDHVMQTGKKNRAVGATLMNQTSSRSHSIFTIVVESLTPGDGAEAEHVCVGKLNLVDLAGSERQSKTGATGDRLQEANKINLSLSALGNVISALVDAKAKHIPYRDSKLTRLLQDSLGGNTKTVMIANCGPADYNYDETLTTLRYASRAKHIKNKPKINEDPKDAMIREFQGEIEALMAKLKALEQEQSSNSSAMNNSLSTMEQQQQQAEQQAQQVVEQEIIEVEKVVEKIVIEKGVSVQEAQEIAARAQREKEEVLKQTQAHLALAAQDKALAEQEKRQVEEKLAKERELAAQLEAQQKALHENLAQLQAQVLVGGNERAMQAAKREDELRRKKLELEERKRQELLLARELAAKEESNLMREEQYQSLQEEAEAKTRKLKKVYAKVKEALAEVKAVEKAHAREREDLLDTVRQLAAQLKLKTLVLERFAPPELVALLETQCLRWRDDEDDYVLEVAPEKAGNNVRRAVVASSTGGSGSNGNGSCYHGRPPTASSLRRPETTSDKQRARRKSATPMDDGIMDTPVDPEDEDDEITRAEEVERMRNPFFVYVSDDEGDGYAPAATRKKAPAATTSSSGRPKTAKKSKSSSSSSSSSKRPETASKRRSQTEAK